MCLNASMSEIIIDLLRKAIEDTRARLVQLEAELAEQERARSQGMNGRRGGSVRRKRRGFRDGSIPQIAELILREGPLEGDALADRVSKKVQKEMNARDLGIALSKYIRKGLVFQRTEEGLYALKK
jgi:hypothetical protein